MARPGPTQADQHPDHREADPGPGPPEPEEEQDEQAAIIADLEDRWRRAAAETENLRKRYARELERIRGVERARVAGAWLPVLDDLERALDHADADPETMMAGIRAIREHAIEVLSRLGYPRDDEVGVPFDPQRHEVVSVVEDRDATPGTVVQVLRPGYGASDGQLRPGAVSVTKARE
ncbi:MAG TPA: nucleotide exchange factor GrpE [Jatrophihabitantaceae bacterium]